MSLHVSSIVRPARVDMSFGPFEPLLKLFEELEVLELGPELLLSVLFAPDTELLLLVALLLSVIAVDCA